MTATGGGARPSARPGPPVAAGTAATARRPSPTRDDKPRPFGPLPEVWSRIDGILTCRGWETHQIDPVLAEFSASSAAATAEERAAVGRLAARAIQDWGLAEAGLAALCAAMMVEHGSPAETSFPAIAGRLPELLRQAMRYPALVQKRYPDRPTATGAPKGHSYVPQTFLEELRKREPEAALAWEGLQDWSLAIIACATRSHASRRRLGGLTLPDLEALACETPWVVCLDALHRAPFEETFVFVDQPSSRVFELAIDAVCINLELHTLLDAALAAPLGHAPPPQAVLDCLSGRGPQSSDVLSEGRWTLYAWQAAPLLRRGAEVPRELRIWSEGQPADVPARDGQRILLAGAPGPPRSWQTARTFDALFPSVRLLREMGEVDARAFLARLG